MGDVATSLVNLLLLPVYTLSHQGGLRDHHDAADGRSRRKGGVQVGDRHRVHAALLRLPRSAGAAAAGSTVFFFLLAVNGALVAGSLVFAGWLSAQLLGSARLAGLVIWVIANTFVAGFFFLPYHVLRIADRSAQFIALTFVRSAATVLARLVLVVWAGWGVPAWCTPT